MAVLEFKTHLYKVFSKPGEITFNAKGDPVEAEGSNEASDFYPCDIVEAGSPNTIKTEDGKLIVYSYTVHADSVSPELYNGQPIEIYDRDKQLVFKGTIKGYSKKQLQTLIWV